MERATEFRGRREDNGEWVHGSLLKMGAARFIVGEVVDWGADYIAPEWWYRVAPESVGEYSGWKDEDKAPIFEGDRLKVVLFDREGRQILSGEAVVEFREGCFGFEWGHRKEFTKLDGFCNTTFYVMPDGVAEGKENAG